MAIKLVFEQKITSATSTMTPKETFVVGLQRQKTAYDQIEVNGKPAAMDGNGKKIRPLWYTDSSDGQVRLGLRWGISKLTLQGGNVLKVGKLSELPSYIDALIDAANAGNFDKELAAAKENAKRPKKK